MQCDVRDSPADSSAGQDQSWYVSEIVAAADLPLTTGHTPQQLPREEEEAAGNKELKSLDENVVSSIYHCSGRWMRVQFEERAPVCDVGM